MTFRNVPNIKLSQLRTFVAIAEAGGFARAAAQLDLTQSAASRQIIALESELGVSLFDRNGQHIRLTVAGEGLLRRARRLLGCADSPDGRGAAPRGRQRRARRVSASTEVQERVRAPFLVHKQQRHPGVEVQLLESPLDRHIQLERGEIHLAIMPALDAQRFSRRLLYPIYLLAVVARAHRLARRAVMDGAEIADGPLLVPKHRFRARARVASA